jgi:hypothetical protein
VEARNLSFITLWPLEHEEDQAEARLNLVWRGKLLRQVSITRDNAGSEIGEVFAALAGMEDLSAQPGEATALVAVPQRELDMLLAVRRWFIEAPRPSTVALNGHGSAEDRLERWRDQALAHALSVL